MDEARGTPEELPEPTQSTTQSQATEGKHWKKSVNTKR